MDKPFGGKVQQWEKHEVAPNAFVFTGIMAEKGRFNSGDKMRSSLIEKISKGDGFLVVETVNTVYHLIGDPDPSLIPEALKNENVVHIVFSDPDDRDPERTISSYF